MQSRNICIIPARGGSKRIPRKNIKIFLGKPIIAYSIEAAINSELFDEVMVSTDDDEIAEIAIKFGAKVPFLRSKNSSSDFATTFDVVEEVIKCYSNINLNFEYTCCIYPCAPFVTKEKIKQGFELLIKKKFDCIMPIIEYGNPIQRALIQKRKSKIDYLNSEFKLTRSQDLEKRFYDAGQFYWLNTLMCLQKCSIFTDNTGGILISELEAQDIDNSTDWKLAEFKYKLL